jgi:competence protein ComEA
MLSNLRHNLLEIRQVKRKEIISEYLSFNRRERIAVLVLTLLIVFVFFLPKLIPANNQKISPVDTAWMASVRNPETREKEKDNWKNDREENSGYYRYDPEKRTYLQKKGELFYFDPNKLSPDEWSRLGLREKTIRTIQNFISKGGRFRKAEDLQKIYGLFPDEYQRIAPYVRIENSNAPITKNEFPDPGTSPVKTYQARYTTIDINAADTSAFIALPGIGSKLAARIVNFREKLGGFYSIEQVGETFGLADSTFQKIKQYLKIGDAAVKKINLNTATLEELKEHPYIRYTLANPIVAYRKEHGAFSRLEDLKKVMAVTEDAYRKVFPYIEIK